MRKEDATRKIFNFVLTLGVNSPIRYGVMIPEIVEVPLIIAVSEPA